MEPLPPARRRFGDKDIAKILKRASELQRAEPSRPDPAGLSLAELEEIADEAGIDVGNLRRAVSELDAKPDSSWGTAYLGAPTKIRFERILPGELTTDDFGRMIPIFQSLPNIVGQANVIGRTLTWTNATPTAPGLRVLVMAQDGETLIRLEERTSSAAGGLHGGLVGGGGFGMGFATAVGMAVAGLIAAGLASGAGILLGTYLLARTLYKRIWNKRRGELTSFFDRLVEFVEANAQQPALGTDEASALPPPSE